MQDQRIFFEATQKKIRPVGQRQKLKKTRKNLNTGETSPDDLFSRTSIKSQHREDIVKIHFTANS